MARKSRYPLNLPPGLHEQIKHESTLVGLSVNEFIVRVLSEYFSKGDLEQRVAELERRVDEIASTVTALGE